jgi:hypothetical protein
MAQRNYDNFIAEQRARIEAGRSNAPLTQSEIDKKYVDDGRGGRVLNAEDAAKLQLQFDALRANNERMGGSRINDIDYIEGGPRYAPMRPQIGVNIQDDIARRNAAMMQYDQAMRAGGAGYAQVDPMTGMQGNQSIYDSLRDYQARTYPVPMAGYMPVDPNTNMPRLMPIQPPQGQQGAMASQYQNPQGQQQQMQNYQNFLQQGMQNSNTMNQSAMNNFANMQPGMQATQTASRATPNQTMPVAGMGMQQPKQTPPRKFSTVRNSPARFA